MKAGAIGDDNFRSMLPLEQPRSEASPLVLMRCGNEAPGSLLILELMSPFMVGLSPPASPSFGRGMLDRLTIGRLLIVTTDMPLYRTAMHLRRGRFASLRYFNLSVLQGRISQPTRRAYYSVQSMACKLGRGPQGR